MSAVLIHRKKPSGNDVEIPEMSEHPDPSASKIAHCIQYVPLLGMMYDVGATPPTPTQLDRFLQMQVLVAALMLTTVASCAASVSFDEIQASLVRFYSPTVGSWHWCTQVNLADLTGPDQEYCNRVLAVKDFSGCTALTNDELVVRGMDNVSAANGYFTAQHVGEKFADCYGWSMVGRFDGGVRFLTDCTAFISCSLFGSFVIYLSLSMASFKDGSGKYSPGMMWGWWKAMVIPLIVSTGFLITGIIRFYNYYWTILQIKYPNLFSEIALATGFTDASSEEQPFLGKSGDSFNFSYLYANWGYFGLGLWAGGCSILFIAVGTVLKNRAYTRAAAATAERLRQADPALIQLLEKAGASHCILGLMEQKLTVAILTSFKDQPVLLRAELKDAGVKTAGDRLAIISTIVGVGSNHTTGASVGFP